MGGLGMAEREIAIAQESEDFQCQSQLPAFPGLRGLSHVTHRGIRAPELALLPLLAEGASHSQLPWET